MFTSRACARASRGVQRHIEATAAAGLSRLTSYRLPHSLLSQQSAKCADAMFDFSGGRAKRLLSLQAPEAVTCAAPHIADTAFLLSGAANGAIHVWQVNNGSLITVGWRGCCCQRTYTCQNCST